MQFYIVENGEQIRINPVRAMYLSWINEFISLECFAGYYGISLECARLVIEQGRELHNAATANL